MTSALGVLGVLGVLLLHPHVKKDFTKHIEMSVENPQNPQNPYHAERLAYLRTAPVVLLAAIGHTIRRPDGPAPEGPPGGPLRVAPPYGRPHLYDSKGEHRPADLCT
jgi:hypothetical protein